MSQQSEPYSWTDMLDNDMTLDIIEQAKAAFLYNLFHAG